MKIKNLVMKVKAGPEDGLGEGQFSGYASVFGNKDSTGDVVVAGAFDEDLKSWAESGSPIPLLWGHNMSDPDFNIGHVLTAAEDEHGLLVTAQLDLDNAKAVSTYRLLKGKRINQMSFAYDVLDGGPEKSDELGDYNELRALKLYEVSVVPIGANQDTEILAVKAAAAALAAVKSGRSISAKNESELRAAHESIGRVLDGLTSQEAPKATAAGSPKDEELSRAKSEEAARSASVDVLLASAISLHTRKGSA